MRSAPVWILCLGSVLVVAGCGEADPPAASGGTVGGAGGGTGTGTGTGTDTGTGTGTGTGGPPEQWTALITADWSLAPGSEKTSDNHALTLDKDVYISAIRPIAPLGTHHTVLGLGGFGAGHIIYASGVGTNAIVFPQGVGLRLHAGDNIVLQLHLFNTSAETLKGTSGIEVIEADPATIQDEADLYLPGPLDFSIPPNQVYSATGKCTVDAKQNIFAIFPHMHQLGTHFKTTLNVGGVDNVIHDSDYEFVHQAFIPFDQITLNPGDSINTECTWKNTTANTVAWGESSTTEMCFSILYRYPAQLGSGPGFCTQ